MGTLSDTQGPVCKAHADDAANKSDIQGDVSRSSKTKPSSFTTCQASRSTVSLSSGYTSKSSLSSNSSISSVLAEKNALTSSIVALAKSKRRQQTVNPAFVDEMRRVLGSLHIKGVSADGLHRARTRKEDAPFATCAAIRDPPLTVIIIGSGFAGFSAAIACARQGFSVILLEKGSGLSPHGDLISFCPNANRILKRWGLTDLMEARSCQGGQMIIQDADGFVINRVYMDDSREAHGTPMYQGHRAQFLGVFGVEARMLGVEVVPYTEVIDILDNLDRPACITADGRVYQSDVVLVADGCNSSLRTIVFGTPSKESCTGYGIHRAITRVTDSFRSDPRCAPLLDGNVRVWLGPDCHAFFAPLDHGRQMSLSVHHRDIDKAASFNWKDIKSMDEVEPFVRGWDETFTTALQHFRTGLHWRLFHHEPIPSWTSANGRIAFLGDAIHTYLPTSFQGATASVEDGACLGMCLALAGGKASGVPLALKVFERLRQDTVRRKAESGAYQRTIWHRYSETKDPKDAILLATRFFGEDSERSTVQQFETVAMEVDKRFRMDRGQFVRAKAAVGL